MNKIWSQRRGKMFSTENGLWMLKIFLNVENVWYELKFTYEKIICLLFRLIFMQELINQTELQNSKKSSNRKIQMIFMEILCKSANEPLSNHNNCKKTDWLIDLVHIRSNQIQNTDSSNLCKFNNSIQYHLFLSPHHCYWCYHHYHHYQCSCEFEWYK